MAVHAQHQPGDVGVQPGAIERRTRPARVAHGVRHVEHRRARPRSRPGAPRAGTRTRCARRPRPRTPRRLGPTSRNARPPPACSRHCSSVMRSLCFRWMSEVARKMCRRGRAAPSMARAAHLDVGPWPRQSAAIWSASHLLGDRARPNRARRARRRGTRPRCTSTPSRSSCRAIFSFSAGVMLHPRRLLAVPQRGVEDGDVVGHDTVTPTGVICAARFTSPRASRSPDRGTT